MSRVPRIGYVSLNIGASAPGPNMATCAGDVGREANKLPEHHTESPFEMASSPASNSASSKRFALAARPASPNRLPTSAITLRRLCLGGLLGALREPVPTGARGDQAKAGKAGQT
jgi:hypothetical protein